MGKGAHDNIGYYWAKAIVILERELTSPIFVSWVKPIQPYLFENGVFYLMVNDVSTKQTLDKRYISMITHVLRAVSENDVSVRVITRDDVDHNGGIREAKVQTLYGSNLKSRYTFDTFVKGKSNEMAFAASQAVAEAPGLTTYNPLYLYGGVGLGKTHLMHSIGNYILHVDPACKVLYTTSENLTNEFIASLRERKNQEFRDKYRKNDVLLVDDIQFLTDKEGIQEEFFHTFNALYNDNKQIVISSDKPPVELRTLEERLRSRFGCGLIVDITLPDFETRTAILEKKAEMDGLKTPKDVLRHIARSVSSNIRELEGALIKVSAYSKLSNVPMSVEMAERALKDMIQEKERQEVTVDTIQETVGKYLHVTPDEMKSKRRTANIVYARHLAMYMSRKIIDLPLLKVGQGFGGRDHTTVIHACNKITDELEQNPSLNDTIVELEKLIRNG